MDVNKVYYGDAKDVLETFPDKVIDMCVTSPPYWGLRDYGVDGQLGLEPSFEDYVDRLCGVFDEVKRVLKDGGTCWVNIGDSYNSHSTGKGGVGGIEGKRKNKHDNRANVHKKYNLVPDKCLVGIPFRFALEMINRGWILRNTIIWHKSNCMPSSVKDRFTVDFEYLFFFSKNKKYYFEQQTEDALTDLPIVKKGTCGHGTVRDKDKPDPWGSMGYSKGKQRNMRCVWNINPKPYKGAHFAVFPEELIETPIQAGCPEKGVVLDPFMGSGTTAAVAKRLNRNYVGIELNNEYHQLIDERLSKVEVFKPLTSF